MDKTPVTDTPRVKSAARTIELLLALSKSQDGLTVSEIVKALEATRQSVYHLLHTLEGIGVVKKSGKKYVYGVSLLPIVTNFLRQFTPQEVLAPIVAQLAQVTGETAFAASWLGDDVTVVASATGRTQITPNAVSFGTIGDVHARASGKLLLSMHTDEEVSRFIDTHELGARTSKTITDPDALWEEIEMIRQLGYATDLGEYDERSNCVAMPYFPIPNCVIAVSAPRARFNENVESYIQALRDSGAKF